MWATIKPFSTTTRDRRGFTIVELLIVIVVIGVLAAITIVAFNGVQNRAKQAAAQSAASQINKKLLAYAAQNSDQFPPDLAAAGIEDGATTFQYSFNNAVSPRTFCVTATAGTTSYYSSSTSTTATLGGCPGHGQKGVAPITNLAINPSAESIISGFSANNSVNSVISRSTAMAYSGLTSILVQAQGTSGGYNGVNMPVAVTANKTYTFSAWVYLNTTYSAGGVAATSNGVGTGVKQGNFINTTGSWQRTSVTFTPTQTGNATFYVITSSASGGPPTTASFYTDGWMVTEGADLYPFADGNTTDWTWNGTTNNSTSTGPPPAN